MNKIKIRIASCVLCIIAMLTIMIVPTFADDDLSDQFPCEYDQFPQGIIFNEGAYDPFTQEQKDTSTYRLAIGMGVGNPDSAYISKAVLQRYRDQSLLDANRPSANGLYVEIEYYDYDLERTVIRKTYYHDMYCFTRNDANGVVLRLGSGKYNYSGDVFGIDIYLREFEGSKYYVSSVEQFIRTSGATTHHPISADQAVIRFYGWNYYNHGIAQENAYGSYYCSLNSVLTRIFNVIESPQAYNESVGYVDGYVAGYDYGMDVGYDYGHEQGYAEGEVAGYGSGYNVGHDDGYAEGFNYGVLKGETDALNDTNTFKDMIFAIFEAPINLINGALNFDILGINVLALVKTLITLAVVAAILTLLIKFIL